MHVFFADDSSQKGHRDGMGKLVAFGGMLMPALNLRDHSRAIDAICKDCGLPSNCEVKWSPPPENWLHDNCKDEKREKLFVRIVEATQQAGATIIVTVWDTGRTSVTDAAAFDKAVDYTFERVSLALVSRGSHCIFVADRPGGGKAQDKEFLERFVARTQAGTEYVPPDRVLMNCLTTPSSMLRQLQVADIFVGATTAMVAGTYKYARPVFERIKPLFNTNYINGAIGGTGLKLVPDDLVNLYAHVLGEDCYWRGTSGSPIPDKRRPFFEDLALKIGA